MIMPLVGGLYHVQWISTLWANAPHQRTLSRTTDFTLVIGSDHLKILCTHHREWLPLWPCPSSEDFATYNGLWPSGPMPLIGELCHVQRTSTLWANAPLRRTLPRTTEFDPLGQRPSPDYFVTYNGLRPSGSTPLIGGLCLCHVQQTSTLWVTMISWQGRAWHKTNDTSRVAPKSDAKRIPKDRMLQAVEEPVRHNDNDLNYLNGLEDFGWTL